MTDRDGIFITYAHTLEPRGVGRGHAGGDHLGDVPVDVVAEEGRGVLGDHSEPAVRQQAGLHESLESVADAQNQTSSGKKPLDGLCHNLVVQHVGDELAASVRLVAGGEAAAEHQDLALVDVLLHLVDGLEHILVGKVAEHGGAHLGPGLAERLRRVVVTVRAREDRKVGDDLVDCRAVIFKIRLFRLERLHILHPLRQQPL